MPLAYFVDRLNPFLGQHWGLIGIRYYGLAYFLGFLVSGWLLYRYARTDRSQLRAAQISCPKSSASFKASRIVSGLIGIGGRS